MANLVESNIWEPGIYQLETNDPVMGGADGIDNLQAKQLAARTQYLKAQQEGHAAAVDPHPQYMTTAESDAAIAAAVAALVNSSPAALDTLAELATALGNDPNFATSITNLLAGKAAKDGDTGLIRTMTPAGGGRVRELGDIPNAATVGGIEHGFCYNCNIDIVTGVWAGRDVAGPCFLEKWSDAGDTKEFWYAATGAAGAVPVWVRKARINVKTGQITLGSRASGWPESFKSVEMERLAIFSAAGAGSQGYIGFGCYWDAGGWKYKETGLAATLISFHETAGIIFSQAAAGVADAAITWTEYGRLQLGGGGGNGQDIRCVGVGQSWVAETANRALATNYINTTGRTIIARCHGVTSAANGYLTALVNGVRQTVNAQPLSGAIVTAFVVVPANHTYRFDGTNVTYNDWQELK